MFLPYELVILVHKIVALVIGYFMWCHVPVEQKLSRLMLCLIGGIYLLLMLAQAILTAYRNHFWFQSVTLEQIGAPHYIRVRIRLRRSIRIKPGQYVLLSIAAGPFSLLQKHPFTIDHCRAETTEELRIVVGVKSGITKALRDLTTRCLTSNIAIVAGPYGHIIPINNYKTVLLVAKGLGFVAVSPYFQWLASAAKSNDTCIFHVDLIWDVTSWGMYFLMVVTRYASG
jgi:predicted ferric reductase